MNQNTRTMDVKKLTLTAVLTALVIILQLVGSFIQFGPFSISLVLLPIVIGAAECGVVTGGFLGGVFGLIVLLFANDAKILMGINAFGTVTTVMLKGILCGLAAGWIYKLFCRKNKYLAVFLAAIVCPIVNTAVFIAGYSFFFYDMIAAEASGNSVLSYVIVGTVGLNFLVEMAINIILSPTVVRLLNIKAL